MKVIQITAAGERSGIDAYLLTDEGTLWSFDAQTNKLEMITLAFPTGGQK